MTVLDSLMLAFAGFEPPDDLRQRLTDAPAAGISLYRYVNVDSPAQLRALTDALQRAAGDRGPLLVAIDQEGGQLNGVAGTTTFPGAMALGATGDAALAERVAHATGTELAAVGVNLDYAPVCDVASNPANPGIGVRSFGDDPSAVAAFAAATVRGLQSAGIAAAAKHFPGLGDAAIDSHHALGSIAGDRARLDSVELVPFRAAIDAGARLVMTAHIAVPALEGRDDLPASLSARITDGLLRGDLGFDGLVITDALNMAALAQGPAAVLDAVSALRAGADLLLCAPDAEAIARLEAGLVQAASRGLLDADRLARTSQRISSLRRWVAGFEQPPLEVVCSAAHRALADEVARRSVTLVRNDAGLLPLRPGPDDTILAVMPQPADLTPADTSSTLAPGLGAALRRHHARVDEIVVSLEPSADEIAAVRARAADADVIIVGTLSASLLPRQAEMIHALAGSALVSVSLRTPFDLAAYPESATHACTYSIAPASLDALAAALFGAASFEGRLPVAIDGIAPRGHGLGLG